MNEIDRAKKLNQRALLKVQIDAHEDMLRDMQEKKFIWNKELWDQQYQLSKKIIANAQIAIQNIDAELQSD